MTDLSFDENIEIGIQKAELAKRNKEEIKTVFDSLSQSYLLKSNQKIHVEIKTKYKNKRPNNLGMLALGSLVNFETEPYEALVLANNQFDKPIAEIIESIDGYPISIKIKDNSTSYYDKENLIAGLQDLVTSTEVGIAYKELISQMDE